MIRKINSLNCSRIKVINVKNPVRLSVKNNINSFNIKFNNAAGLIINNNFLIISAIWEVLQYND